MAPRRHSVAHVYTTEDVEAKERFVAWMTYEIRTPTSAILPECNFLEECNGIAVVANLCNQLVLLPYDSLTMDKLHPRNRLLG